MIGSAIQAQLILSETAQRSLDVAVEVQLKVYASPYVANRGPPCELVTRPTLLTDKFSLTKRFSKQAQLASIRYLYREDRVWAYQYTYLVFRMFRIYGEKSSSSLPRVGGMPSTPGPSQRTVFGRVGMNNRKRSCFMNVILEVLASLRSVSHEILGIRRPGVWLNGVQNVLYDLLTKDNPCTVEGRDLPFSGQHDAHEFYIRIRREGVKDTDGTREAHRWNNLIVGTSFTLISKPSGELHSERKTNLRRLVFP